MIRIHAAVIPVSTMALVKLDTLIKDFVVNVLQGSLAHTAIKVIEYKTVKRTDVTIGYSGRWQFQFFFSLPFFVFNVACSFDFEDGIGGWEMTGTAFIYQPTFGDNPAARNRESAQQQGDWWIGGVEYRPSESDTAGRHNPAGWQKSARGDLLQGTLISPCFRIVGRDISFLIGGGCPRNNIRAELIVDNQVRLFTLTVMFHLILLRQPK